jgi:ABC-type sugar transport system substrate-binding protein
MISVRSRGILMAGALAGCMAVTACTSGNASTNTTTSGGQTSSAVYTSAEVAAASGVYKVKPIFAVPKHLPHSYTFAFISPGETYPYFAAWQQGMEAAAKFYHVQLDTADLNFQYQNALSAYQTLALKNPTVIGTGSGPMNAPLYNAIKKNGAKIVLIDAQYANVPWYGVNNTQVGQFAVQLMQKPAQQKMAGSWKGKPLYVVGMSAPNCPPCNARVDASFAEAKTLLGIPSSHDSFLIPPGQDPTTSAQSTFSEWLTAHPNDAALVVSYGDEPVVGAVNAAKADNRGGDVLGVSNGGDPVARAALRTSSDNGILVSAIDYEPYQEGWNWIEAAIATELGKPFGTYNVSRVLMSQNVNSFYPNDPK